MLSSGGMLEVVEDRHGDFLISTDRARLDLEVIHGFLTNCYWARGIPREVVARSIEHSLCFGVYDESPRLAKDARHGAPGQVGFARAVSDFATVAYLGDIFILESHRGRGLSRWILLTRDAHELYAKFGFTKVQAPERYMELHNPNVYQPSFIEPNRKTK
jgi:GNAT superfamily N-acetyltransferase